MTAPQVIRVTGVLIIVLIALVVFGTLAFLSGPQIEGVLFPIIHANHLGGSVIWHGRELCWGVAFEKYRNDAPAYFNYRLITKKTHERVPLAVYRMDERTGKRVYLSTYGFAHHVEGEHWTSTYCAEIPHEIDIERPFEVEGEGFYATPHHLWLVPQDLPDFTVDREAG